MTTNQSQVHDTLFQDAMDSTRFVRIRDEKQTTVVCKVWFGKNKNNLIFHGTVELPKRLFFFEGGTRIGFNPAREEEEQPKRAMRPPRRRDYDDYEE